MTSRSRRPRSIPKQVAAPTPPARKRSVSDLAQYSTELEQELKRVRAAMEQQKREFEQESVEVPQLLSRLAHGERALGQTKTKLIAAEEAIERANAQLASLRARVQDSEAKLQERAEQELELQSELSGLRDALAAALEREPTFQRAEQALKAELDELRLALAATKQERDELVAALGAIEVLSQRIGRMSREPRAQGAESPPTPGPESDDKRVTSRPVAAARH